MLEFVKMESINNHNQTLHNIVKYINFDDFSIEQTTINCLVYQRTIVGQQYTLLQAFYDQKYILFTKNANDIMFKIKLKNKDFKRNYQLAKFKLDNIIPF